MKKWQDSYTFDDHGELVSFERSRGYYCRSRTVQGVQTCLNTVVRPAALDIDAALKSWGPVFEHGGMERMHDEWVTSMSSAGMTDADVYDDDASALDAHYTMDIWNAIRAALEPIFRHHSCEGAVLATIDSHILLPRIFRGDVAFLAKMKGIMPSGTVLTSPINKAFNSIRVFWSLGKAAGVSPSIVRDAALRGALPYRSLGDDTLMAWPGALDPEVYDEASAEIGFKANIGRTPIFLMTRLSVNHPPHGVASRALMNSVFREHEPKSEIIEIIGLYERLVRTEHDPYFPIVEKAIFGAPEHKWLNSWNVGSLRDLDALVSSPNFQLMAQQELRSPSQRVFSDLRNHFLGLARGDEAKAQHALSRWLTDYLQLDSTEFRLTQDVEEVLESTLGSDKTADNAFRAAMSVFTSSGPPRS